MMTGEQRDQRFVNDCHSLLNQVDCDFVGLAIQNQKGPDINWYYAIGNENEKYKRITVRYGKGIAGKVILTGAPMSIQFFPEHISGKATDYPIMLAEKLIHSYAAPILCKGSPKGVLLIGRRQGEIFNEGEKEKVQQVAANMEEWLNSIFVCYCEKDLLTEGAENNG
ncbi:GAF domain-containing protein [Bacillus marasmi]|uniref:GAF domain-containing protein n=1 Tax=Bacillus marasmi TaxID=1926279 RepID=UPI0011C80D4F|nr:GAF domain-containing protein [Bacillus marasmi]